MRLIRRKNGSAGAATLAVQGEGRISLAGELSFSSVPQLLRQSPEVFAGRQPIVLDLAGVRWADSAGLALLLEWLAQARRLGRPLQFVHVPEQILHMAEVSGLQDLLPLAG
jgi:phospholipid transport system transporter-binding protein